MKNDGQAEAWLYGVKAIADHLGVTDRTVRRWLSDAGLQMPVHRLGGRWFAHPDDLRQWTDRRARAA